MAGLSYSIAPIFAHCQWLHYWIGFILSFSINSDQSQLTILPRGDVGFHTTSKLNLESFDIVDTECLQGVIELLLLQQNIFNYSYSRIRCAIGMGVFGEITCKMNAALGKS